MIEYNLPGLVLISIILLYNCADNINIINENYNTIVFNISTLILSAQLYNNIIEIKTKPGKLYSIIIIFGVINQCF